MGLEPTAFCMASRFKACGAFPIRIEFPVNKPVAGSGGRARPVQPRLQLSASQCRHARRGGRPTPLFRLRAANSAPSPIRHPPCLPSSASADSARRTHTRGRCGRWPGARAARRPAAGFGGPLDQSPATHAPEGGRFRPGRNPPEHGSNTTVFKDEDLTREFSMTWLGARAVARSIAARRSSTRC
jgi:hypothetical protein